MRLFFQKHLLLQSLFLGVFLGFSQLSIPLLKWFSLAGIPLFLFVIFGEKSFPKRRFGAVLSFKFGYYLAALYWIPAALLIDFEHFFWMIPFALFGIPLVLALFFALLFLCVPWERFQNRFLFFVCFVSLWVLADFLQTYLFTGFPWAFLSYMWIDCLPLAQGFYLIGTYGMTALSLAFLGLPFLFDRSRAFFAYSITMTLIILGFFLWGKGRLQQPSGEKTPSCWVRLVQPNLAQRIKWESAYERKNFEKIMGLSKRLSAHPLQAIIWPEAAFTYDLTPRFGAYLEKKFPTLPLFITGFVRQSERGDEKKLWNSIAVLQLRERRLLSFYDKTHLVPFGEYIPLRHFLEFFLGRGKLKKITHGLLDFTEGSGRKVVHTKELPPFYPLVCYEMIFPLGFEKGKEPAWILNLTNDAWFGDTDGPLQHLAIARVRAIETGIPVVRVANTGITAAIDRYGAVVKSLPLHRDGILDVDMAALLQNAPFLS